MCQKIEIPKPVLVENSAVSDEICISSYLLIYLSNTWKSESSNWTHLSSAENSRDPLSHMKAWLVNPSTCILKPSIELLKSLFILTRFRMFFLLFCFVFSFWTAAGLAGCYFCLDNDVASSFKYQWNQTCPSVWSLVTTHCASAVGKKRHEDGSIRDHFNRNCVNGDSQLTFNFKKKLTRLICVLNDLDLPSASLACSGVNVKAHTTIYS